ncbi:hypothetical protein F4813DRAFT_392714 [Daldinia decipiens]|uniref:uncharacterized protein n=1 Tax=Daldinia decipiens TaxID=326647 RepID=UPI0020C210D4|nr:uncharacterized protein F4813DRAFT_392714 [Daldinia decipiens]KAI1654462.1 hypothetical protein F4813DRAFT_392714 [Daldinia decipiens]
MDKIQRLPKFAIIGVNHLDQLVEAISRLESGIVDYPYRKNPLIRVEEEAVRAHLGDIVSAKRSLEGAATEEEKKSPEEKKVNPYLTNMRKISLALAKLENIKRRLEELMAWNFSVKARYSR